MASEPWSARASATRWETYDPAKAENFLNWLQESGIGFSMDKIIESGDRNDILNKWVFFYPGEKLVEFIAKRTM